MVRLCADSGDYDLVLAVSTPHPPNHTAQRVEALLALETATPVLHLWMAGDQAQAGLRALRESGLPVTEEPRAAVSALAGLGKLASAAPRRPVEPLTGTWEEWGLPLVEGAVVSDPAEAVRAADRLGYPVVVKLEAPGLSHRTEIGGVRLDLTDSAAVRAAFRAVVESAQGAGVAATQARVQRYRPGLEVIVGAVNDDTFGPVVSVGLGGVLTELLGDVVFAPAPVRGHQARAMIDRLRGRQLLEGFRGEAPSDLDELARIISVVSRGLVGAGLQEMEINPLVWDGAEWVAVDWLVVDRP